MINVAQPRPAVQKAVPEALYGELARLPAGKEFIIETRTSPALVSGSPLDGRLEKLARTAVRPVTTGSPRWGRRVGDSALLMHKGERYLELAIQWQECRYFVEGREVPERNVWDHLANPVTGQGDVRTYKLASITAAEIDGQRWETITGEQPVPQSVEPAGEGEVATAAPAVTTQSRLSHDPVTTEENQVRASMLDLYLAADALRPLAEKIGAEFGLCLVPHVRKVEGAHRLAVCLMIGSRDCGHFHPAGTDEAALRRGVARVLRQMAETIEGGRQKSRGWAYAV